MKPESGKTVSLWMGTADVPQFGSLSTAMQTDVCIVGGGIAGLTAAYLLLKSGRRVVLLDDNDIAGGETQRTTAHLSNEIDDRYYEVIKLHGKDKAKLAWDSQTKAIDLIEKIALDESIQCDFRRVPGYLFVGEGDSKKELDKELKALQEIGWNEPQLVSNLPWNFLSEPMPAIEFPQQAQIHALKYMSALANSVAKSGGQIFTYTHVTEVKEQDEFVEVHTANGAVVRAANVIVATNSPVTDWLKVHSKQSAYRTYAICAQVPKNLIPMGLYWDTLDPYHYVRLQPADSPAYDYCIIGGEDHRTGEAHNFDERFQRLEDWSRKLIPQLGNIEYRWSGQVYEPVDFLPFIGKDPAYKGRVFIATGDSGMGMTNGTCAAMLISDLIIGNQNDWADVYDPARKPIGAAMEYLGENINTGAQYLQYLKPSEVKDASTLQAGEGAVIDRNGQKLAVSCDSQGGICAFSAVCPHAKAIVQWNELEQSWDCPAHGSRFNAQGQVIDGPANCNLKPVQFEAQTPGEQERDSVNMPDAEDWGTEAR